MLHGIQPRRCLDEAGIAVGVVDAQRSALMLAILCSVFRRTLREQQQALSLIRKWCRWCRSPVVMRNTKSNFDDFETSTNARQLDVMTLEAITNTSDLTCVKGIWYAVADAMQMWWNQMGNQAKGFFVALLFGPHPGKQRGDKETLCLGPHLDCISKCVPGAFDASDFGCVAMRVSYYLYDTPTQCEQLLGLDGVYNRSELVNNQ
ncbi:hypothetical protein B0H13DRAFT_1894501 [Mycena leptocephala]|nr:hypothetical protein B0H13DRAFT_1894501 [Mycena leptocephala]